MGNKKEKIERKSLEAWARKEFFDDELGQFLKYCDDIQFRSPDEVMSEKEFKSLKSGIKLSKEGWGWISLTSFFKISRYKFLIFFEKMRGENLNLIIQKLVIIELLAFYL